jgi:hypothetical protein
LGFSFSTAAVYFSAYIILSPGYGGGLLLLVIPVNEGAVAFAQADNELDIAHRQFRDQHFSLPVEENDPFRTILGEKDIAFYEWKSHHIVVSDLTDPPMNQGNHLFVKSKVDFPIARNMPAR